MFLVVKLGERRCCGESFWVVVAASENIVLRRVSSLKWDSWRRWGRWPLIAVMRLPAAAMMASAGVVVGLDMYLCLWETINDTQVARVLIIQIFHAR